MKCETPAFASGSSREPGADPEAERDRADVLEALGDQRARPSPAPRDVVLHRAMVARPRPALAAIAPPAANVIVRRQDASETSPSTPERRTDPRRGRAGVTLVFGYRRGAERAPPRGRDAILGMQAPWIVPASPVARARRARARSALAVAVTAERRARPCGGGAPRARSSATGSTPILPLRPGEVVRVVWLRRRTAPSTRAASAGHDRRRACVRHRSRCSACSFRAAPFCPRSSSAGRGGRVRRRGVRTLVLHVQPLVVVVVGASGPCSRRARLRRPPAPR